MPPSVGPRVRCGHSHFGLLGCWPAVTDVTNARMRKVACKVITASFPGPSSYPSPGPELNHSQQVLVTSLERRLSRSERAGHSSARSRRRSLGQGMVELALVTPVLLLIFAAAADLGRAYFSYVAIENAAKEGALVGSRNPLCDDSSTAGCNDPNNVLWIVQNELAGQNIRNPDGSELTPTVACVDHLTGTTWPDLDDCAEGDTYEVTVVHPFQTLTPMLGSIIGNLNLTSTARAVVLNEAFDPSPGASIQKLVSPVGATNMADIVANCVEPEPVDAPGFYRSPCLNETTTNDQNDTLKVAFESDVTINYRITISNSGAQNLTGVTVVDKVNGVAASTGCTFPTTIAVGAAPTVCNYSRTAPTPPGAAITMDSTNSATIDFGPDRARVRLRHGPGRQAPGHTGRRQVGQPVQGWQ